MIWFARYIDSWKVTDGDALMMFPSSGRKDSNSIEIRCKNSPSELYGRSHLKRLISAMDYIIGLDLKDHIYFITSTDEGKQIGIFDPMFLNKSWMIDDAKDEDENG